MKKVLKNCSALMLLMVLSLTLHAQTVDSTSTNVNTDPQSTTTPGTTINVAPETVVIADTTVSAPTAASSTSYRETETIRIYSGSHSGNNIVRTIEVPLPAANSRNGYYSPR
jgi:hypothetical protein